MKRRYLLPHTFHQQVLDYPGDGLVQKILHGHRLADVVTDINTLLGARRAEVTCAAFTFLRDCAQFGHARREGFRGHVSASKELWETLRSFLYSDVAEFRRAAIYTTGKLLMKRKASLLKEAFPWYLQNDPINLSGIISEWGWLTRRSELDWISQIGCSKLYLVRWSLCDISCGSSCGRPEVLERKMELFKAFSSDPHPWLAAEARYRLAQMVAEQNSAQDPEHLSPPFDQTFNGLAEHFLRTSIKGQLPAFDRYVRRAVKAFTGH